MIVNGRKKILDLHPTWFKKITPWKPLLPWNYGKASVNTWAVGNILAYVNGKILQTLETDSVATSCIGHSLGSHVCGFFGKMSKKLVPKVEVDKIMGLDPAGPIFDYTGQDKSLRLDKDDAKSVEIFHTNSKMYGYRDPIGDVDFYINGGNYQFGRNKSISEQRQNTLSGKSHSYSVELFTHLQNIYVPCYAKWKCNISKGSDLLDILDENRIDLESKHCFETSSNVSLGDLDDLHTNQSGVYWIDIDEDSKTCQYDRGIFNISRHVI